MKRHLNRKKDRLKEIDPENVAFWESLFSTPCTVLLDRKSGARLTLEGDDRTYSWMFAAFRLVESEKQAVCVLQKRTPECHPGYRGLHSIYQTIPRDYHMITAFYFPLIGGLCNVRLEIGGQLVGEWTPEGSEFREPPLPLGALLEECRSLPEINWSHILEGCQRPADYPVIYHDFGRDLEIDGEKYRRAVLVHPCIALVGRYQEVRLVFYFEQGQKFAFYQESWVLGPTQRRHLAKFVPAFADTLESHSTVLDCFGMYEFGEPNESALIQGLKKDRATQRTLVNLDALQASARR